MNFRSLATTAALCLSVATFPCINDRDTLAEEARALSASMQDQEVGLIQVLSGRFERNPPLYYKMRIDRVKKELAADPSQIELYDDIAAAYDRLGESGEALAWIEKKRALLEKQGRMTDANKEQWYRYWANAGTFKAHKFFKDGAKPEQKSELESAAQMIEQAIEIKPDAHFGREAAQLEVMRWFLQKDHGIESLASYINGKWDGDRDRQIEGLAGLIRLGNAWQSPDVHDAIAFLCLLTHREPVLHFAAHRSSELVGGGAKPIGELNFNQPNASDPEDVEVASEFKRLRTEADQWHADRQSFMLARLKIGKHPDTHPDFWKGYVDVPAPQPVDSLFTRNADAGSMGLFIGGGVAIFLLALYFAIRAKGRLRHG
jgi:tetratricopeptide (TPR) repeat protein